MTAAQYLSWMFILLCAAVCLLAVAQSLPSRHAGFAAAACGLLATVAAVLAALL